MVDLLERIQGLDAGWDESIPLPGSGRTSDRHRALLEFGRRDLSLARIAEAHTDALAILAEAGRAPKPGALYGVWASEGPHSLVSARRDTRAGWRLDGLKQYCSGAPFVTSALVTAKYEGAVWLFEVEIDQLRVLTEPSTWATPAFADTATGPVSFHDAPLPADCLLGEPNWYLTRPGFWHGAIGPAACWAGGAASLIDAASRLNRRDAHSRAQLGALQATQWGLSALLDQSGQEIDADPFDLRGIARVRALTVRHLIERMCTDVLDRFGRATGPQLLAYDEPIARQHMALALYIRQCHGERDLESIVAQSLN